MKKLNKRVIREAMKWDIYCYLFVYELSPESCHGFFIGIFREDGIGFPSFVDVFENDKGLGNWFAVVDQHRNLLVNRIGLEKQRALVRQILFYVFIVYAFDFESHLHSSTEGARP